ncbi:hypothetical protein BGZ58_004034 [Dissophora ornata]|nr:hypothetical protein BGZ58_004034 [Dissophora ornata]
MQQQLNTFYNGNNNRFKKHKWDAPHNNRASSIVFPLYRPEEHAHNLCLEMLYHFACHLEKVPISANTEATFVAHSVMSMLSPIQHEQRQHLQYDQVSKVVKRRRPDIRLMHNKKEILFAEVTSPVRASDQKKVSIDLVRLGRFMKAAINNGVPKVVGVHVEEKTLMSKSWQLLGNVARFYHMELKGCAIYIMQQYGTFHLPQQYSAQTVLYFETISKTQVILNDVKDRIDQPPSSKFLEWIRPQMDSPTLRKYF